LAENATVDYPAMTGKSSAEAACQSGLSICQVFHPKQSKHRTTLKLSRRTKVQLWPVGWSALLGSYTLIDRNSAIRQDSHSVKQWLKRRITQSLLMVTMLASLLCLF
jgi:hypothetical protein